MGAVRHRELIRLLSFAVTLNMAIGVVALVVRSDNGSGRAKTAQFAGSIPLGSDQGGILAGGNFNDRRGSGNPSATRPPTSAAPSPTTGPAAPTPTTAAPAPTATTLGAPGTTATTRPVPAGTTPTSGRVGAGKAPPATTATSSPAATGDKGHSNVQTDPTGDTVVDGTHDPIKEARADIVRAGAVYEPGTISLALQVAQPTDPSKDPKWAGDSTFANWSLDTNGDGTPDFDIQYYFDSGEIGGTVSRPGTQDVVCDADTAGYSPDGYWLTVAPSCLGDPASFSYRVTMFYDTNPKDANADVASDVTPNGGLSFPVTRPN